jgi:hypothetical protein
VQLTEVIVKSYNAAQVTLDTHLDSAIPKHGIMHEADSTFLRQATYGIIRYSSFLQAFQTAFYHHCAALATRADAHMYNIVTYLTILRFPELGMEQFVSIVRSQEAPKMAVWLRFLFSKEHLKGELRDEWLKIFDKAFVDEKIGAPAC